MWDKNSGRTRGRGGFGAEETRCELTLQLLALEGATPMWPKFQHFAVDISCGLDTGHLPPEARCVSGLWLCVLLLCMNVPSVALERSLSHTATACIRKLVTGLSAVWWLLTHLPHLIFSTFATASRRGVRPPSSQTRCASAHGPSLAREHSDPGCSSISICFGYVTGLSSPTLIRISPIADYCSGIACAGYLRVIVHRVKPIRQSTAPRHLHRTMGFQ